MNDFTDKIKGTANEVVGKAKVAIGNTIENPSMVAEGVLQETKGKVQNVVADVKSKLDKAK